MIDKFKARWKMLVGVLLVTVILASASMFLDIADAQNKTIYWGSRGNDVINAQVKLSNWGYYDGIVDGVYGAETYDAVKQFQAKNGLRVDGVVGAQTWKALGFNPTYAQANQNIAQNQGGNKNKGASNTNVNRGDEWLLAKVVAGEARSEPYIGKVAVAAVLLNRVDSPKFPDTLSGVVYQPMAFESVSNGQYNREVPDDALRAAREAISGYDPTGGALFFWNPYKPVSKWIWSRTITGQFGKHVFGV